MLHVSVNFVPAPAPGKPPPLKQFRRSTWLVENARHVKRFGSSGGEKLCVVLVGATDCIPQNILDELSDSFTVRIETQLYERICEGFPTLVARLGGMYRIFSFAFMRWLLIERLFDWAPVLCYDGDILHNVPLDQLSAAFRGITRTATSTAFAAISNPDWFRSWARHLELLERAPSPDFDRHVTRLAGGYDTFNATPEEYFAKLLIEAGELPQDELDISFPFWIVPQPHLLPRLYNFVETKALNRIPVPMSYARTGGTDTLNGKPLAFWHMQKPFMSQLSALAIFREKQPQTDPQTIHAYNFYGQIATEKRVRQIDPYHSDGGYDTVPANLEQLALSLLRLDAQFAQSSVADERNPFHPAFLYRYYFQHRDFSLLFNNHRWPKPGCWSA